jgi:hypothetical protein
MSGLMWMMRIPTRLIPIFDILWSFTNSDKLDRIDSRFPVLLDSVVFDW